MYPSDSMPQSGLLQRQPQRYSDRHQQQVTGLGKLQPRGWYAALQRRNIDKSKHSAECTQRKTEMKDQETGGQ